MNSVLFSIPEELTEILNTYEYIDDNQVIKIQFTNKFGRKVVFQPFKVKAFEKSLKDLVRKVKGAVPELTDSEYVSIENVIYENLNVMKELQNGGQSSNNVEKTLQLRKFEFDGKTNESILVNNRPYFITSDESVSSGYSLEERIEVAGNTF
ncbi:MAG TPA: hypothetical protein VFG45_09830 [Candidatus Nitrosocosmicus sp.]|nr:hypothetical protein [Candidatus Nitrosocosmicus sp.]